MCKSILHTISSDYKIILVARYYCEHNIFNLALYVYIIYITTIISIK